LKKRQDTAENEIFIKPPSQSQIADYAIGKVYVYSKNTVSEPTKSAIRKQMNKRIRAYRMSAEGLSEEKLKAIEFDLDLETKKVKEGEETQGIEILSKGIGIVMGFAIYMLLAIYGSILMQSVIEEKTNRIVEVIVSSVKPFQLLLGKIVALVGVAFTQLMIWGVAIFVIYLAAMPYLLSSVQGMEPAQVAEMDLTNAQDLAYQIQTEVELFDWSILWFLPLFFIGGFFIYGSLYAAVGSAVDNVQDAQQLVFPVMLPLILSILVGMNVIQNPNSTLAVVCSYIPFFSPMIMPVRMAATDVAWWEIILSLLSLGAGFLGCVWLAAKVYRTGILMYGKKASFKELWRWIKA
jgi:ABC-2 type transport system permease protein